MSELSTGAETDLGREGCGVWWSRSRAVACSVRSDIQEELASGGPGLGSSRDEKEADHAMWPASVTPSVGLRRQPVGLSGSSVPAAVVSAASRGAARPSRASAWASASQTW